MHKAMTTFRLHVVTLAAIAATLLTGCLVGPKYHVPPAAAQAPPRTNDARQAFEDLFKK